MNDNAISDGQQVRCFIRAHGAGALASVDPGHGGAPSNALVTYACDFDGSPLFLFSTLSEHTRNLAKDKRAALLVEAAKGRRNPQTGPRVTLAGTVAKLPARDIEAARARFLARHPDAALYAGFGDFAFYRMTVERVHWVGGFAQARWIPAKRVMIRDKAAIAAIAEAAPGVIEHMNADHADAIDLCARVLLGRKGAGWRLTGIDPDGCDLRLGARTARLDFDEMASDAGDCRTQLVTLTKRARATG
ncbi:MAG: DUF2470 domain-containing protein [Rhodospirillales bacterium]